jgi:Pterin 4 alpha carbinolamine dehydratase
VAEKRNHHPDIFVRGWIKVRLILSTHPGGGLTHADHALRGASTRSPAGKFGAAIAPSLATLASSP